MDKDKEILKRKLLPGGRGTADGELVLVRWWKEPGCKYVVWFHNLQTGGFSQGYYYESLGTALEYFDAEAKKEDAKPA